MNIKFLSHLFQSFLSTLHLILFLFYFHLLTINVWNVIQKQPRVKLRLNFTRFFNVCASRKRKKNKMRSGFIKSEVFNPVDSDKFSWRHPLVVVIFRIRKEKKKNQKVQKREKKISLVMMMIKLM